MNRIVSREEWTRARLELLEQEKAFTRQRDALSEARRALPLVKVDKPYVFEEPTGKRTLPELFEGRKQLVVYHFMFDPKWEEGCSHCSYVVDHFGGMEQHLAARDTAFAVISRAPASKLAAFQKRMGWTFRWLSSAGSDFSYDFHASFRAADVAANAVNFNYRVRPFPLEDGPGMSVFLREGEDVLHSYSTYERGIDQLINTYNLLDLTPLGRQEENDPHGMAWVKHHDRYEAR